MVNDDLKQLLFVLYQEFGDQGMAWVQEQVAARLSEPAADSSAQDDADTAGPETETETDETIYDDGEAFSAKTQAGVQDLAADSLLSPEHVIDAVFGLITLAGEVRKFEEAQVTKRIGIAAERDIAIASIKAQQELLQNYLDRSFDERAENFSRLFTVVDNALETNNMTALAMGLESVVKLAASSPFKDLRTVEATAAALANPDHEWDF